ncbi:MAG TPA: dodecin family protein [Anaeromyxobacter sp.]|nr:dodecin family protein [Anaeromyxobacter sp.]
MTSSVYKIVEVVGSSPESWEKAAQLASRPPPGPAPSHRRSRLLAQAPRRAPT